MLWKSLKWYVFIAFSSQTKSPYFSHYNPKISSSNSLYFRSYSRKCTYFRFTNFDFLMYFHNSLIPSVTFLFLPKDRKIRSNLEVKLYKMCLRGHCWLVKSENTHVKMGTYHFKNDLVFVQTLCGYFTLKMRKLREVHLNPESQNFVFSDLLLKRVFFFCFVLFLFCFLFCFFGYCLRIFWWKIK